MNRILVILLVAFPGMALADIDVGSNGSDLAFDPNSNVTIDLSLAATADWDSTSPVPGQGIYDPNEWAVVFHYTTVNIPAGVTVTFTNHPSRAPVVWLVQGDVVIEGTVDVSGADGHGDGEPVGYAEPGPGGFRGGRGAQISAFPSSGFGPGGGGFGVNWNQVSGGSYASAGEGYEPGAIYGNSAILPLIGGSGGSGLLWPDHECAGGGGGGGAILIGANTSISVSGSIVANGGVGGKVAYRAAGGSGGAIRLVADYVAGDGELRALGGESGSADGGEGRIRVEGNTVNLTDPGDPLFVEDTPGFVFPPAGTPKLRATALNAVDVPDDPEGVIDDPVDVDVNINTCDSITLEIEAENVPLDTTVDVRVVPASGYSSVFTSTPLAGTYESSDATADVSFPAGYSVVQLRAEFETGGGKYYGMSETYRPQRLRELVIVAAANIIAAVMQDSSSPAVIHDLRTLSGERVTKMQYAGGAHGGGRVVYVTETGRRIPVDIR